MKDLLELAKILPNYIILFCPGYLTIYMYYFFCGKKMKYTQWILAKAICLSYVYLNIVSGDMKIHIRKLEWCISRTLCLLVLGILIGIVASKIHDSDFYNKILETIKEDRSFGRSEFDVICDDKTRSMWLKVHLKEEQIIYEGSLRAEELNEETRKYIVLGGYRKYIQNSNGKIKYLENHEKQENRMLVIYYDEIQMIEKL